MAKRISFVFLFIVIALWSSACSSNQAANSILGTWEGTPGLTVPGMMIDSTYSYNSFTFYKDVVVFRSEFDEEIAFSYDFTDADTLALTDVVANSVGTLKLTQEDPESLVLTLAYDGKPDEVYESGLLNKVADVEIEEGVTIQESILGSWTGKLENREVLVEFIAGSMFLTGEEVIELAHYEFQAPNRLVIHNLIDRYYYVIESEDNSSLIEIRMPNEDTLLFWMVDEIQNVDNQVELVASDFLVLRRESSPSPTLSRPDDEVLYPFYEADTQCGYIDHEGKIAVPVKFAACGDFSEGLARVAPFKFLRDTGFELLDYYGYIDNSGQFVIKPQFAYAGNFVEGIALVREFAGEESVGYINNTGDYIIQPQYDNGDDFSDGLAYVNTLNPEWGAYIDKNGDVAFEISDDEFYGYGFHEGLLRVENGYLDKTGRMVISWSDVDNYDFSEGLAALKSWGTGTCFYINTEGEATIQTDYSGCGEFSDGLAAVYNYDSDTCGYINTKGNTVIDFRFKQCWDFSEGRAVVLIGDKWGIIDKDGKTIFGPAEFQFVRNFNEGLARLGNGNNWGYIDLDGKYVLQP